MENEFNKRNSDMINKMSEDRELQDKGKELLVHSSRYEYSYHFTWMGRPIIQFPQDIVAIQEIIWRVKPDLIIETGIAHGGSLIFSASMLELIGENGKVLGIDIDIRKHNREAIEEHPMSKRISMIEGSSIDLAVLEKVRKHCEGKHNIMVVLDSMHTHEHVLRELELYSPLVSSGSYLIVLDTVIEDMPDDFFPDRPWGKGNNPKTAVHEFLRQNSRFEIDREIQDKLLITVGPDGYLKRIRD